MNTEGTIQKQDGYISENSYKRKREEYNSIRKEKKSKKHKKNNYCKEWIKIGYPDVCGSCHKMSKHKHIVHITENTILSEKDTPLKCNNCELMYVFRYHCRCGKYDGYGHPTIDDL